MLDLCRHVVHSGHDHFQSGTAILTKHVDFVDDNLHAATADGHAASHRRQQPVSVVACHGDPGHFVYQCHCPNVVPLLP